MSAEQAVIDGGGIKSRSISRTDIGLGIAGVILAVILGIAAATTEGFFSLDNFRAILTSVGFVGIVALGMTMIMLSGNLFSLSLGTTVAVGAMFFLYALQFGVVPAIVMTLILGAVIGAIQGFVVGAWGANPIIVTIAAGALQSGIAVSFTGGASIVPPPGNTSFEFLTDLYLGLPFPVYVLLVLTVLGEIFLRRTRMGKELYFVGENADAARAAAISVAKIGVFAFAVAGACAGLAGLLLGAFNQNATMLVAGTYTFDAIAAALVGGSAVSGGKGSLARTLLGALVIAIISDLLLLRGYGIGVRIAVTGLIVLIVVLIPYIRSNGGRK